MAQTFEEVLLQAIQKDDIKAFNALMEDAQCGRYRLGRFPVLSLLYLYSSRSIISAYEEKFAKISAWDELREPASIVKLFSEKAGKCLRLYLNEVVSPLEMLLILDRTKRLKRIFSLSNPSKAVKSRLQSIYSIKYSLGIKFEGDKIIIERRPLSYGEKKRIIAACTACVLAVTIAVATPTTAVALFGKRSGGDVTRLSHIDFAAQTTYTLKKDITIPDNFSVKQMNCTIAGGGHKLILGKNASLGELGGKMSDLEISTSGSPIFTVCTQNSSLLNVTVNVNADLETSEDCALVAVTNYGTIDGVTVNVSGKVSAASGGADELIFGGIVAGNANTIKNCTVNYYDFSIKGEATANATFAGIIGVNRGFVQDCKVTGKISSDTFDLAGVCYVNYNQLSGIVNTADLSQTSADGWYPVVGGIAIDNIGSISYCQNTGNIVVDGQYEATCGGIAARTYIEIDYCISRGDITVTAPTACVGGVFGLSGIASNGRDIYICEVDHCLTEGKITVALGEGTSYIGGIGGYIQDFVIDKTNNVYLGCSVVNCIFLGVFKMNYDCFGNEVEENFDCFGNIIGVCGENTYEINSYTLDGKKYLTFDKNYYIDNSLYPSSFGALETTVTEGETTEKEIVKIKGKGKWAESATEDEIKNTETYKDILEKLGR